MLVETELLKNHGRTEICLFKRPITNALNSQSAKLPDVLQPTSRTSKRCFTCCLLVFETKRKTQSMLAR